MIEENNIQFEDLKRLSKTLEVNWKNFNNFIDNNTQAQVIIIFGPPKSGKTTLFHLLQNGEIQLQNNSQHENDLNYCYLDQDKREILLDFSNILNKRKVEGQLIWEEFFLRLLKSFSIKILFVLQHQEDDFKTEDLHQKIFVSNILEMKFTLVLNKYQEELEEQQLVQYVQNQLKNLVGFSIPNITVIKQMKSIADQNEYMQSKVKSIHTFITSQESLKLNSHQFQLDNNVSSDLNILFWSQNLNQINQEHREFNNQVHQFQLEELEKKKIDFSNKLQNLRNYGLELSYWVQQMNIQSNVDESVFKFENVINQTQILQKLQELSIRSIQNQERDCQIQIDRLQNQQKQNSLAHQHLNKQSDDQVQISETPQNINQCKTQEHKNQSERLNMNQNQEGSLDWSCLRNIFHPSYWRSKKSQNKQESSESTNQICEQELESNFIKKFENLMQEVQNKPQNIQPDFQELLNSIHQALHKYNQSKQQEKQQQRSNNDDFPNN